MKKGFGAAALAAALTVFGLACSDTGSQDIQLDRCDYILIPGITTGASFSDATEVDCPIDFTLPMTVFVDFLQAEGGAGPTVPPTQLSSFILDKYIVSYRNITQNGANTPRTHVPEPFLFTTSSVVQAFPSTFTFDGPILRSAARGQPPLNNDSFFTIGTDPLTGVVLEAEIVWWGHPVAQPSRECRGTMVFRFTVYDVPSRTPSEIAFQDAICAAEFGG